MAEDKDRSWPGLLAVPDRIEIGPANVAPQYSGPLSEIALQILLGQSLFSPGIEFGALARKPRAVQKEGDTDRIPLSTTPADGLRGRASSG